jgi:hypothetical protein
MVESAQIRPFRRRPQHPQPPHTPHFHISTIPLFHSQVLTYSSREHKTLNLRETRGEKHPNHTTPHHNSASRHTASRQEQRRPTRSPASSSSHEDHILVPSHAHSGRQRHAVAPSPRSHLQEQRHLETHLKEFDDIQAGLWIYTAGLKTPRDCWIGTEVTANIEAPPSRSLGPPRAPPHSKTSDRLWRHSTRSWTGCGWLDRCFCSSQLFPPLAYTDQEEEGRSCNPSCWPRCVLFFAGC